MYGNTKTNKMELLRRLSVQSVNSPHDKDSDVLPPERPRTAGAKRGGRSRGKPGEKFTRHEGLDAGHSDTPSKTKPPTAPKPKSKTRQAISVKTEKADPPHPEWKREHIVTLINSSPFPSYTKSFRLSEPSEIDKDKEKTKSRGTQSKVKMNSRFIQVAPQTASIQLQTSTTNMSSVYAPKETGDNGKKDNFECPGPHIPESIITDIGEDLTSIFHLVKDIDLKAEDVKGKEEDILNTLASISQDHVDVNFLRELPEQIHELHDLFEENGVGENNDKEIVSLLEERFSHVQEELQNLKQQLAYNKSRVPAPIIQPVNGEAVEHLDTESIENTVRVCHRDVDKSIKELSQSVTHVSKYLSEIKRQMMQLKVEMERQIAPVSNTNSEEILATVKDIHALLLAKGTLPKPPALPREPYVGPCRCGDLRNGIPKHRNTSSHSVNGFKETVDPCQKCLNDYRGTVFINLWDLPLPITPGLSAILGHIIECLEYDNHVQLSIALHNLTSQAQGWSDEAFTEFYLALFTVSLGWNNIRCPLIIANFLDINTLIETQFGKHLRDQQTILDVMGQLLCRLDPATRTASLTSPYLSGLLFNAVKCRNLVAFNFLVINKSPLDEVRGGRSVLHEIAYQSYIHKEDSEAQQCLLKMLDMIYEHAGAWWEAQSRAGPAEDTTSNDSTSENESSSDSELSSTTTAATARDSPSPPTGPTSRTEIGEDFKINALRYLFSTKDEKGMSPLQYAVGCASVGIIEKMLSELPYKCVPDPMEYTFDTHRQCFVVDDIDGSTAQRGVSALDIILTRPPKESSKLLSTEPFKSMINDRWNRYYVFGWLWLFIYLFYMAVYTACAIHRPVGKGVLADMYKTGSDKARAVGEVFVLLGLVGFVYAEIRDIWRLGWVWPWPWTFSGLPRLINFSFFVLTITALALRLLQNEGEDIPLSLALILGWMNAGYFLVLWKEARLIPLILHTIVMKDFCAKFFWLFALAFVATSSATVCVYQNSIEHIDGLDGQDIWGMPFVLYQFIFGLGDTAYSGQARNAGIGYTLFLFHIGFMGLILVNILVAMVIYTYMMMKKEEVALNLWLKAWMVQLLDRRLVPGLSVKYHRSTGCIDRLHQGHVRYQLRFSLRKDTQGQMTEVQEHLVMIAP